MARLNGGVPAPITTPPRTGNGPCAAAMAAEKDDDEDEEDEDEDDDDDDENDNGYPMDAAGGRVNMDAGAVKDAAATDAVVAASAAAMAAATAEDVCRVKGAVACRPGRLEERLFPGIDEKRYGETRKEEGRGGGGWLVGRLVGW